MQYLERVMTLAEFLTARLDEDVCDVGSLECPCNLAHDGTHAAFCPERVLADVKAKRAIVESGPFRCGIENETDEWGEVAHYPHPDWAYCDGCSGAESLDRHWSQTLGHLASVYEDHSDYRQEWKP